MSWYVMPTFESWEAANESFSWDLPPSYHPATDLLEKHDDPDRTALIYVEEPPDGVVEYSFADLHVASDRLATVLADRGLSDGDRLGVVVGQRPANPVTHLAAWKVGAITVPMTVLFGPDALSYRLQDSGASVAVVEGNCRGDVETAAGECPELDTVVDVGDGCADLAALLDGVDRFDEPLEATPETHTAIMYTSGSTGPPKGVLHSHALWLGRAAAAFNFFDQGLHDATVWTPADWAWGAALGGALFGTWHHGGTVVGWPRQSFDAAAVFEVLEAQDVTHSFLPPTALRMLMRVEEPEVQYDLSLETLASVGEPLTPEIVEWVDGAFADVPINEFYGQTELNLVIATSANWFDLKPGSMGRVLPGYETKVVDPDSLEEVPHGEPGELLVRAGDRRVFFDEYWEKPDATAAKAVGDGWFRTGDLVEKDEDGYHWFVSRTDDVILTRGYRVGPMEVESAILDHPAVEQVGVVGVPHHTYGEAIAAFVRPTASPEDPAALAEEIKASVREGLAAYEYPDEIHFVDSLPKTSTGKVRRTELREQATPG